MHDVSGQHCTVQRNCIGVINTKKTMQHDASIEATMHAGNKTSHPEVWALLDTWATEDNSRGRLLDILQRHIRSQWGLADRQDLGPSQADILSKELFLEAETKLVSIFAFMAHCKSATVVSLARRTCKISRLLLAQHMAPAL